ncbi:hypothetical protein NKI72_27160 [Mesorhizobium sp. M0437]|uniref:hypothetical protein n=1 Tax=Mesorhizobium sp. M0437 TaxID=2956945 RepID=UPI00333AA837
MSRTRIEPHVRRRGIAIRQAGHIEQEFIGRLRRTNSVEGYDTRRSHLLLVYVALCVALPFGLRLFL